MRVERIEVMVDTAKEPIGQYEDCSFLGQGGGRGTWK
jgi:hypothetical protein